MQDFMMEKHRIVKKIRMVDENIEKWITQLEVEIRSPNRL